MTYNRRKITDPAPADKNDKSPTTGELIIRYAEQGMHPHEIQDQLAKDGIITTRGNINKTISVARREGSAIPKFNVRPKELKKTRRAASGSALADDHKRERQKAGKLLAAGVSAGELILQGKIDLDPVEIYELDNSLAPINGMAMKLIELKRLGWITEEAENLSQGIDQTISRIAALQREIQEKQRQIVSLQNEVSGKDGEIERAGEENKRLNSQISDYFRACQIANMRADQIVEDNATLKKAIKKYGETKALELIEYFNTEDEKLFRLRSIDAQIEQRRQLDFQERQKMAQERIAFDQHMKDEHALLDQIV
ncbi:MAG: hypothetical protein ABSE82_13185, partial [Nitrososphaerales archaeon]